MDLLCATRLASSFYNHCIVKYRNQNIFTTIWSYEQFCDLRIQNWSSFLGGKIMIIIRINGEKIKKIYVWIVKLPMDSDICSTCTLHSYHYFNLTIGRQKLLWIVIPVWGCDVIGTGHFFLPSENAIMIPPFVMQVNILAWIIECTIC